MKFLLKFLVFLRQTQMQLNCSLQTFSFSIIFVIMKLHDKRKNLLSSKAQWKYFCFPLRYRIICRHDSGVHCFIIFQIRSSIAGVKRENLTLKSLQHLAVSEESEIRILITMRVKPFQAIISAGCEAFSIFLKWNVIQFHYCFFSPDEI